MHTKHIFLIGPMGAGKSTIGKQLAKTLDRPFFDVDYEIVKSAGADIPWIFDMEGEEGFRRRETNMLIKIIDHSRPSVVATGGGVVLNGQNCEAMEASGLVVYLTATKKQLYERTKRDKNRPLLQVEDRRRMIDHLLEERGPRYQNIAHIVAASGNAQPQILVDELVTRLSHY
ncbi:MAG: shikimate kinase [Porticoccaceae bacterium]|nr:shikimate kinase [Porticoccaceae bacterium]MDG1473636.1 shikimate kinase [Porticoccaceae bacterium]